MDIDTPPDDTHVDDDPVDYLSDSNSLGEDNEGQSSETQPDNQGQRISRLRGPGPFRSRRKPLRGTVVGPASESWKCENVSVEQSKRLTAILMTMPNIDLKAYLSRHSGVTCIAEAELIADRCPELAKEAMTIAVETCFQSNFVASWIRLKTKYRTASFWKGDIFKSQVYKDWLAEAENQSVATLSRLDGDLSSNKARLYSDGIRDVYKRMGDYHIAQGDLSTALTCYVAMQDYCTTPVQMMEMYLKNIEISVGLKNFSNVKKIVVKAERTDVFSSLPIFQAQTKIASALAMLDNKKYTSAALTFLGYGHVIGSTFSSVVLAEDVAIYGGLLGIASLSRSQLNRLCISLDGPGVVLLELVPWVRDIVMDFYNNSWKSCLQGLARMLPILNIDLYLHPHVSYLYHVILNNCLIQCFTPYSRYDASNKRIWFWFGDQADMVAYD